MDIILSKQCFIAALARLNGIADQRSSMQVLSNVLISTQAGNSVLMSATDLNLSASGVFPAQVIDGGETTLPAKTLFNIVKSMPEGPISLKVDNSEKVELIGGRSNFTLVGIPAEDFPSVAADSEVEFFEVPADILAKMIDQTAFSISTDETRPHLNGALFVGDGKILRMVTTDGHRLSKVEAKSDQSGFFNFSMVIPHKGVQEIRKLLDDTSGTLSIGTFEGSIFVKRDIEVEKAVDDEPAKTASFTLVSKLIEADFPPYDQVIPKNQEKKITIPRVALLDALKRVSVVSSDRTLGVKFSFDEGAVNITTDNPSVGWGSELVDVDYVDAPMEIGFNARYFIEVLSVLFSEDLVLELTGSLDPAVVVDEGSSFIGVIMPMRI